MAQRQACTGDPRRGNARRSVARRLPGGGLPADAAATAQITGARLINSYAAAAPL